MNFLYKEAQRVKNLIDAKISTILERDLSLVLQPEKSVGLWFMTFGYDRNYKSTGNELFELENNRKKIEDFMNQIESESVRTSLSRPSNNSKPSDVLNCQRAF